MHILKNIRNNWITEKSKCISFCLLNDIKVTTNWSHIVNIQEKEKHSIIRRTTLNKKACFPSNLERQNVSLVLKIFNEKTEAALRCDGHSNTAYFIQHVTKMFNIVNVKRPNVHKILNDPNRAQIEFVEDERLQFLLAYAAAVKIMLSAKGFNRYHCFTRQTRDAIFQTLSGLVYIIWLKS